MRDDDKQFIGSASNYAGYSVCYVNSFYKVKYFKATNRPLDLDVCFYAVYAGRLTII